MAGSRFLKPRQAQLFEKTIPLVDTARYLVGDTWYTAEHVALYRPGQNKSCPEAGTLVLSP